jgi:hypothetical protein
MRTKVIILLLLLIGLLIPPALAINSTELNSRILAEIVLINASPSGATNVKNFYWDGTGTGRAITTAFIETTGNNLNNVTFKITYGSGKTVNGFILTTEEISYPGSWLYGIRAVEIGLGTDNVSAIRQKDMLKYRISYGQNLVTKYRGIDLTSIAGNDLLIYAELQVYKYTLTAASGALIGTLVDWFQRSIDYDYGTEIATFYEYDNIINEPINKIEFTSNEPFSIMIWTTDSKKFSTEANQNIMETDIQKLITGFILTFASICSTLFIFEAVIVLNAPWIFIAVEVVGSMLVIWNSNGNIFKTVKGWWRLQEKIIDFFMYIPTFIEKHWQFAMITIIITIIGAFGGAITDIIGKLT